MTYRNKQLAAALGIVLVLSGCGANTENPSSATGDSIANKAAAAQKQAGMQANTVAEMVVDGPSYPTLEELAKASAAVVTVDIRRSETGLEYPNYDSADPKVNPYIGTGKSPSPEEIEKMGSPVTLHYAVVSSVAAGELEPGSEIVIMELGGLVNGIDYKVMGSESLRPGQLLFLSRTPNGKYQTVGGSQGRLNPDGKGGFVSAASPEIRITGKLELKDLLGS